MITCGTMKETLLERARHLRLEAQQWEDDVKNRLVMWSKYGASPNDVKQGIATLVKVAEMLEEAAGGRR